MQTSSSLDVDVRQRLREVLGGSSVDESVRPAMAKLTNDQAEVTVRILGGFDDRREVLEWMQDVAIHSLGNLEDRWFTRVACSSPMMSAMLGKPWGTSDGVGPERAVEVRRSVVAKDLLPAFHRAHRAFRWAAVERVDHLDDEGENSRDPIDPLDQRYPAMRPSLGELDDHQEWALERLLDGFESEDDLLLWIQQVIAASYAEIDEDVARRPYFEIRLKRYLTASDASPRARFVRESWAAKYLLPSFNRAAAALADRSEEVTAGDTATESSSGGIS